MSAKELRGLFIALDGIDGSGKATQTKLLVKRLTREGHRVRTIDFPRHGEPSAFFIDRYLQGAYGVSKAVDPRVTSLFYACDRYDASFQVRRWLKEGYVVVSDRYVAANLGHQGGKLVHSKKEWRAYVDWTQAVEYELFDIPKPDVYVLFDIPAALSMKSSGTGADRRKRTRRTAYLGTRKQDAHERDREHLEGARRSYRLLAETFPRDFTLIPCADERGFFPREQIHDEVWRLVAAKLRHEA